MKHWQWSVWTEGNKMKNEQWRKLEQWSAEWLNLDKTWTVKSK